MNKKAIIGGSILMGTFVAIYLYEYYMAKLSGGASEIQIKRIDPEAINKPEKQREVKGKEKINAPKIVEKIEKNNDTLFPLKLGSKGEEVKELQMYLLRRYGWADVQMGTYDSLTAERVIRFLKASNVSEALYKKLIKSVK